MFESLSARARRVLRRVGALRILGVGTAWVLLRDWLPGGDIAWRHLIARWHLRLSCGIARGNLEARGSLRRVCARRVTCGSLGVALGIGLRISLLILRRISGRSLRISITSWGYHCRHCHSWHLLLHRVTSWVSLLTRLHHRCCSLWFVC